MRDQMGKKRIGRPSKAPKPGERAALSLRVTAETKRKLDAAAQEAKRSLSQEAEFRIESSFRDRDLLIEALRLAYGRELAAMLIAIGDHMKLAGQTTAFVKTATLEASRQWWDNPYAFSQAMAAAKILLEQAAPIGDATPPTITPLIEIGDQIPESVRTIDYANLGQNLTKSFIQEIITGESSTPANKDRLAWFRDNLGSMLEHMKTRAKKTSKKS
jgi:hypothetical protein